MLFSLLTFRLGMQMSVISDGDGEYIPVSIFIGTQNTHCACSLPVCCLVSIRAWGLCGQGAKA